MAPYWDDKPGDVLYRISNNQTLLDKISSHIADAFSEFSPTMLFIATWNRVPQSSSENNTQFNTFQAVIAADNNTNVTIVLFLYGDIQWSSDLPSIGFNSENRLRYYNQEISTTNIAFRVDQENIQFLNTTSPMENTMESTYVCIIPHNYSITCDLYIIILQLFLDLVMHT